MYSSIALGLALTLGAPGAKDPPKKDADIVGDWIVQTLFVGGLDASPPKDREVRFSFSADGKLTETLGEGKPDVSPYKVDVKKVPGEIDIDPPADGKDPGARGIFKIEGDTLTLCFVAGKETPRPTKFESAKAKLSTLITFKRVKK